MCDPVTLLVVTAAATATAAAASGYVAYEQADQAKAAAKAEYKFQQYQSEVERRQLAEDMEAERIAAMETESARLREFRHAKALNQAAIVASGLGSSQSFEQGAMQSADDVVRRDLASLRFTTASSVSRLADQIGVSRTQLGYQRYGSKLAQRMAGIQKTAAVVGTAAEIAGAGAKGYGKYEQYKTSGKLETA